MREMPVLAEGATQSPKKLLEVLAYAVDIRGIKWKAPLDLHSRLNNNCIKP